MYFLLNMGIFQPTLLLCHRNIYIYIYRVINRRFSGIIQNEEKHYGLRPDLGNITWRKLPVMLPFILKISRLRTTSPNHQLTTTRSNIWLKYIFGLHMNHMKKTSFQWRTCCSDTTFLLKGSKYHGFISYLFKRGGLKKDDRF